jgi:hypothetical protein
VPISQLQNESIKLTGDSNNIQNNPRATFNESLYSVVLNQILKPNNWTPPVRDDLPSG